jgi:hypothetical protein
MKKWLVAVLLGLLACPVRTQAESPDGKGLWERAQWVAGRLEGRVLGALVRRGMTSEEVERLLGEGTGECRSHGLAGCVLFEFWHYHECGFAISFDKDLNDKSGVARVNTVTFWPLWLDFSHSPLGHPSKPPPGLRP